MKPTLSKNYSEITLELDNWLEKLDKSDEESEVLDLENIIEGSYETTFEGIRIVFELESDLIFDFLAPEDIDTLSNSKLFLNNFLSM